MSGEHLLILLADDDEVDRMAMMKAIASLGAKVDEAATGQEALDKCRENDYDCIVLDHLLPDYDSFQLIPEIRHADPMAPIIVVTGYGNELLAVKMLKAGALDYIPKDKLTADLLKKSITEALKVHQQNLEEKATASDSMDALKEIAVAAAARAEEMNHETNTLKVDLSICND
jgi:DNA-binding NtrC family response regulator